MNQPFLTAKVGLTALFSGLAAFLGWRGIAALAWVGVMALDYISGTAAACKAGQWNSAAARSGLWHKGGMILVVLASAIADGVLGMLCSHLPGDALRWPYVVLPLVLAWYIITELGSILENAVKLGAPVPQWLIKLLKTGKETLDKPLTN